MNYGRTGVAYGNGDANYDGVVDGLDLGIISAVFGSALPIV